MLRRVVVQERQFEVTREANAKKEAHTCWRGCSQHAAVGAPRSREIHD
jgi:hypothetical protein